MPTDAPFYLVMRRNPQVAAGWSADLTPRMDATVICRDTCRTNIGRRLVTTEFQVFGLYPTGEAVPLGDRSSFTYPP